MENESSIKEIIRNSLEQVRSIIDADTIVGKQIVTSTGMVIIPISKLSMGIATGGLDLPTPEGGKKNFGGGGGTGVSVVPVGFLTITPEGKVDMIPMTSEKLTPVEVVADLIYNSPDIIGRIKNVLLNGYQEAVAEAEAEAEAQPELAQEYEDQLILETPSSDAAVVAPILADDAAMATEQILFSDEGASFAESRTGRKQKIELKEKKKREKEAAKLQKKADKSAAKMARIQADILALQMAMDAAQTPEEREYLQTALTEAQIDAQIEGEKQAVIVAEQQALEASAPAYDTASIIADGKTRATALTPADRESQIQAEILAFNAALAAAKTPEEKQAII